MGQSALDSRGAELLVTVAVVGVVSVVAASSIATMGTRPSKTLIAIVVVAVASVLLSLSRQQLFLGWLFAAPLLQESATATRLGHPLSLAIYTAPPLALLAKMLS